jgi:hypothetical protein
LRQLSAIKTLGRRTDYEINILMFKSKSLIIVHLNQETSFDQILFHKKLTKLLDNYFSYENNRKLTQCKVLQTGNYHIHFRSKFKGKMAFRIIVLMSNNNHI